MPEESSSPLDLPPERMRELGYRVIDLLVERHRQLRDLPAWTGATRTQLHGVLDEAPPEEAGDFEAALDRLCEALRYGARVDHPRFMAFVPGVPTWPGVLGDLLAAGTNIFQGTWLASSGASAVELVVIDWIRQWLSCPEGTAGLLLSGGSAANITAIACARITRFGAHAPGAVIYCSSETHSSVLRAARVLGFADDRVRRIAVDAEDRLDIGALEEAVAHDRAAGLTPFLVVANGGTTSTGAVDPLDLLAEYAAAAGLWLHVDAAYGGFAALTGRGRALLEGIERADSIALDPHKWLYQPFEAGCLLVREGHRLEAAFRILPPYLQDTLLPGEDPAVSATHPRPVNFADQGIQLTRAARALKLWLSIQTFGVAAFRTAIDRSLDLTLYAERHIRDEDRFELLTPARLGIVCFRLRAHRENDHDALNRAALQALLDSGAGMISSTRVRGSFALRLCILNHRTRDDDVDAILQWLAAFPGSPGERGLPSRRSGV